MNLNPNSEFLKDNCFVSGYVVSLLDEFIESPIPLQEDYDTLFGLLSSNIVALEKAMDQLLFNYKNTKHLINMLNNAMELKNTDQKIQCDKMKQKLQQIEDEFLVKDFDMVIEI